MTMAMRRALVASVCAVLLLAPDVAFACPVCFSAQNEDNRAAFVAMTAFLTLLPLGMLGVGLGWVWRRMQRQDASESLAPIGDRDRPTAAVDRNH